MESFSLSCASGWNKLSTLLAADATFKGLYLWTMFSIKDTHASQTIIVKSQTSTPAGGDASGVNLAAGTSFTWDAGNQGIIDGNAIWVKASGAATTIDVSFIRKTGV